MNRNKVPIFEPGIRALECPKCQSTTTLNIQVGQLHCRDCKASFPIVNGVIDLLPPGYSGYPGDTKEAAALRDAHNRQSLREDTLHLRSTLTRLLRPNALLLDAGCGTGQLARMISEAHPDAIIIATDVSLPMCRLAARNCSGHPVLVVRTPNSRNPPIPFRNTVFDIVLNRLAPMDRMETFRLLRPGGYTISARYISAYWQEIRRVFPKERLITHSRDPVPLEALAHSGFSEAETHEWRITKIRSLDEIVLMLSYTPILRDFNETADRPFLNRLEALYGDQEGIRLTEGESLIVGRKNVN